MMRIKAAICGLVFVGCFGAAQSQPQETPGPSKVFGAAQHMKHSKPELSKVHTVIFVSGARMKRLQANGFTPRPGVLFVNMDEAVVSPSGNVALGKNARLN